MLLPTVGLASLNKQSFTDTCSDSSMHMTYVKTVFLYVYMCALTTLLCTDLHFHTYCTVCVLYEHFSYITHMSTKQLKRGPTAFQVHVLPYFTF